MTAGNENETPRVAVLAQEVERLRQLVGPSETAYVALRRDRDEAQRVAKAAVHDAGELRGQLAEMSVQLSRARQEQDLALRRLDMTTAERWADRVGRRWTGSVAPRLRRLVGRAR